MVRERLEYDVVIVGAGPSGLSAACRLMQLAESAGKTISVCIVEKGAEVGSHLLSGAVLQTTALDELFPDWKERGAPVNVPVTEDEVYYFISEKRGVRFPHVLANRVMPNQGNYVISLGVLCRWLACEAEQLGVEIYPGFTAEEALYSNNDSVIGVRTSDMGVDAEGHAKPGFQSGVDLIAKYTLFAEGCRGHIGKSLIKKFNLDKGSGTQHFALGIKEMWEINPDRHEPGKVLHSFGWPLSRSKTTGGAFLYHFENNQVSLGMIVDLNYSNPYLSPFDELQLWKQHPKVKTLLEGGERIAYGARAINKGGFQAIPDLVFPGGMLVGCEAGFMNYPKIKGNHTAMKSGMLAAEATFEMLNNKSQGGEVAHTYPKKIANSWINSELKSSRNVAPAMHRFGMFLGAAYAFLDYGLIRGRLPWTLKDNKPDHACLALAFDSKQIEYPKPDGKIAFDKLSSVYLSNTAHEEDQVCHLFLKDADLPIHKNLPLFQEPAQRYCPAGVYEVIEKQGKFQLVINAQNCVHCKTCDIKDPFQNITWLPPEAGGGPNYGAM